MLKQGARTGRGGVPLSFRTIAYNVLECTGFPDGAPAHMVTPAAFAEALAGYAPDVVTLAECPERESVLAVAAHLEMACVFFPSAERWPGALLTRLPLLAAENCPHPSGVRPAADFTRHWGRALLLAGGGDGGGAEVVAVHSVHLHPSDGATREREVLAVLEAVRADREAGARVVVQGDLNHRPDMPEYEWWWNGGLYDTFEPEDPGEGYTYRSDIPMARLDYIWVDRELAPRVVRGRPLAEPPFVPTEEHPWALSDHIPQLAVIEPPRGQVGPGRLDSDVR